MKNSILKGALSSYNAKKEVSTKNFEVITSLGSIKGGLESALGCTNCKKKQTQTNNGTVTIPQVISLPISFIISINPLMWSACG